LKYYSEEQIHDQFDPFEYEVFLKWQDFDSINVRLCRDCPYFEQDHPTIDTDGDFGYCSYKTDFTVLDDEPIHWYFTDINGFCNENDIKEEN
jgi:hypothetical protein